MLSRALASLAAAMAWSRCLSASNTRFSAARSNADALPAAGALAPSADMDRLFRIQCLSFTIVLCGTGRGCCGVRSPVERPRICAFDGADAVGSSGSTMGNAMAGQAAPPSSSTGLTGLGGPTDGASFPALLPCSTAPSGSHT